uniref:Uncharacterized protein n=2 Tax=Triticum urartu TaxID=4572 RepID=A0A8R7UWU5_TRIUA
MPSRAAVALHAEPCCRRPPPLQSGAAEHPSDRSRQSLQVGAVGRPPPRPLPSSATESARGSSAFPRVHHGIVLLFSAAVHAGEHGGLPTTPSSPMAASTVPLHLDPCRWKPDAVVSTKPDFPSLLHPPSTELVILPYCCFFFCCQIDGGAISERIGDWF